MKYDKHNALIATSIPGLPAPKVGKVRDIYDLGDTLLLVATDRISSFDCVMPNGIPGKGKILTQISKFWFDLLDWQPNHLISMDVKDFPPEAQKVGADLEGRTMLVTKTEVIQIECIARGYPVGSGWKEYQKSSSVCGLPLPAGYKQASKLAEAIFTPSSKAEIGMHDENISYEEMVNSTDAETAAQLREKTLKIYNTCAEFAAKKNIIIADTKFEFGRNKDGEIILIDEVLTPDSSRFWPAEQYCTGSNPPSLDKQYVRDYLEEIDLNKEPPAPELPKEVVAKTKEKYLKALAMLTS